jgi:hypothetical protein
MEYVKIYTLEKDGIPYYIGKTTQSLKYRLRNHKHKSIDSCITLIDEVPQSEWKFWEVWYIELFRNWGFYLTNKNNGGGGVDKVSATTKSKISKGRKKYLKSINYQVYSGEYTPQRRETMKSTWKHIWETQRETLSKNISVSKKGKPMPPNRKNKGLKPIICETLYGMEFLSIKQASEVLGLNDGGIVSNLKGNKQHVQGFTFTYKKDFESQK